MGGLIERTTELAAVSVVLARAEGGHGGSVLLAGPAGIGRSAVVGAAQDSARLSGLGVLSSCATPVSTGLPHHLVRDWLGPLVRSTRPGATPFDGPAAELAEALATASVRHPVWNLAQLDHALTWALESLSAARPLLLAVDDLQWLDPASLQLLDLLSARLPGLPVALVMTVRSGEPSRHLDIVDRIAARATALEPAALTVAGVELLRRELPGPPRLHDLSAAELHRLTGGVPYLVHELLRHDSRDVAPREVVEWVRERLSRLGGVASDLARAVAVLGEEARFDGLAALTGLTVAELADPLATLTDAGVLETEMWQARTACPLLTDAILAALAPSERSELHRSAAAYLRDIGTSTQALAEHLVHTLPQEDPAVVELLTSAGAEALDSGAPDVAARFLLRAVAETRPEDTSAAVLDLAASAHLLSGRPHAAFDLWSRAVERAPEPSHRARLLMSVGDARATLGGTTEAAEAYREAACALTASVHTSPGSQQTEALLRQGLTRAWRDGAGVGPVSSAALPQQDPAGDTHNDRLRFALAAFELALRGESRTTARDLALRALGDGALLAEETSDGAGFYTACAVLSWAGAHAESLQALNAAVKDAHLRGSVPGIATASYCRGLLHLRQGRLRQARGDFQAALCLRAQGWSHFGEAAVAGAALTHVAVGRYDDALALEPALRAAAAQGHFLGALPLAAAGLVRSTHGDHEQALQDFARAGRLMGAHPDNGSVVEWRELSVWSLAALGRREEAREVAEQALLHARRWGAPRGLGYALRALAQVSSPDRSVELLREALVHLDAGGCADYRARAWTDLGRLLLASSAGEREEGVALLRRALEYGRVNRVPSAVLRATRLLVRAGERVSDPSADPAESLTPGERRVVELAVAGETNRQIAQKLFVTMKAVEWHLSNAYRKLGISTRRELASALYGETGPRSSSAM